MREGGCMSDDSWVEPAFWLSYIGIGFLSLGMMATKVGSAAIIFSVFWPASWLAYLGWWLAS
ncbi:MAG: hypothetical protein DI604_31165 [Delftia acidovorans]|nr:MAG: hypothetical protein DI604_31165 [Delftia acidovorans]